jgi:hypothetical protein
MKMFQIVCDKLYVEEAIPETDSLLLTADPKKAYTGQEIDADLYRDFASTKTGLKFVLIGH